MHQRGNWDVYTENQTLYSRYIRPFLSNDSTHDASNQIHAKPLSARAPRFVYDSLSTCLKKRPYPLPSVLGFQNVSGLHQTFQSFDRTIPDFRDSDCWISPKSPGETPSSSSSDDSNAAQWQKECPGRRFWGLKSSMVEWKMGISKIGIFPCWKTSSFGLELHFCTSKSQTSWLCTG